MTEAVAHWTRVDCWNFSRPLILHSTLVWLSATWAILVRLLDYERVDSRCARDWNWNVKTFNGGSTSFCFSLFYFSFLVFFCQDPLLPSLFIYFFHLRKILHIATSPALSGITMLPWRPMGTAGDGCHSYIPGVFLLSSLWLFFPLWLLGHYRLSWELFVCIREFLSVLESAGPLLLLLPCCSQGSDKHFFFPFTFHIISLSCSRCGGEIQLLPSSFREVSVT